MVLASTNCLDAKSNQPGHRERPMRLWFVAFAVACDIPLQVAHKLFPHQTPFLPLGGEEFTQLAILVLTAVFFEELNAFMIESLRYLIRTVRRLKKDSKTDGK
jgi:hypothetical protein